MFTDISVSTDLNNKFNAHLKDKNVELGMESLNYQFSQRNHFNAILIIFLSNSQESIYQSKCYKLERGLWDQHNRQYHLLYHKSLKNRFECLKPSIMTISMAVN